MQKEHKNYLDYLRVAAMIAVVAMHSAGYADDNVEPCSLQWQLCNIIGSTTHWAVPVFVMISGTLMLGKENVSIDGIWKKSILRMVIAYLFWAAMYELIIGTIPYYDLFSIGALINMLFGTAAGGHFHLWFMPMLIGLYAFTPLLHRFVRALDKRLMVYWLILGFVVCSILPALRLNEKLDALVGYNVDHFNNGFLGLFVFYFTLGYYLDRVFIPKRYRIILYIGGIISLIFTFLVVAIASYITDSEMIALRLHDAPNVAISAIAIFVFAKYHVKEHTKTGNVIQFLANSSFGLYLVHEMILYLSKDFMLERFSPIVAMLLMIVLVFLVGLPAVTFIRKLNRVGKYIV